MADEVRLTLDTKDFLRTLRLTEEQMKKATASALNSTAFEVIGELRREASRAFAKASPRGKQLVGGKGSFVYDQAKPDRLVATVKPGPNPPKRGSILAEHERGGIITPAKNRLGLQEDFLAVPTGAKRDSRGRIPTAQTPAKLLSRARRRKKRGKGFTAGKRVFVAISAKGTGAILERRGEGSNSRPFSLYALVPKAELPRIFRWEETVRAAAQRWLPIKMREKVERLGKN